MYCGVIKKEKESQQLLALSACVSQGRVWLCELLAAVSQSRAICGHESSAGCVAVHLLPVCPQSVLFFPGGSPTFSDNHLWVTITLRFLQSPDAVAFKLINECGWFPSGHWEEAALPGSVQFEYFSVSLKLAVYNDSSWTQIPPCRVWQSGHFHGNAVFSLLTSQVLGPCHRCQMICIDQQTGQRNQNVFQKLSERRERKVSMIAKNDTPF